jgi:hypothetical protein
MPVSLRIPEAVKKRVARRAEEARAAFHAEAERRLAGMKRSGAGIPAHQVFDYLLARARGRKPARPKTRKIA